MGKHLIVAQSYMNSGLTKRVSTFCNVLDGEVHFDDARSLERTLVWFLEATRPTAPNEYTRYFKSGGYSTFEGSLPVGFFMGEP